MKVGGHREGKAIEKEVLNEGVSSTAKGASKSISHTRDYRGSVGIM